jgi:hypothetical protein
VSERETEVGDSRDLRQVEQHTASPLGRAIRLALFLLPLMYVAAILAAVVHEVLGHGLAAMLIGVSFEGFRVGWAGGGQAFTVIPPWAPRGHQVLHLASGIIVTIVCGGVSLGLVPLFRRRIIAQLALLVGALAFLGSSIWYVLWNSYDPVAPGDVGRIILLCCGDRPPETSVIRWVLLIAAAVLSAGVTLCFYRAIFIRLEAFITNNRQLRGGWRLLVLSSFLVLPTAIPSFIFDWNQAIPGIGRLPNIMHVAVVVGVVALLFWHRPMLKHQGPIRTITWRPVAVSWMCLIATITPVALWLNNGIRWGSEAEEEKGPRIVGPLAVSASGDFLLCGAKRENIDRHYVVPLKSASKPILLDFPDSGLCLGVTWKAGEDYDDLLYVTGGEIVQIRTLRVSSAGISEVSSYSPDPHIVVGLPSDYGNPVGGVLALRATNYSSHQQGLGFSEDNGATVTISNIPAPGELSWMNDHTFYVAHGVGEDKTVARVELNIEDMTWQVSNVSTEPGAILATRGLHGCPVYAVGKKILLDTKLLALLPEEVTRPIVDGDYLACASRKGKTIYILDDKGELIDKRRGRKWHLLWACQQRISAST